MAKAKTINQLVIEEIKQLLGDKLNSRDVASLVKLAESGDTEALRDVVGDLKMSNKLNQTDMAKFVKFLKEIEPIAKIVGGLLAVL